MYTYIIKSVCTLHIVLYFFYRVDIIWLLLDYENVLDHVYISGVATVFATRGGPYTCHPGRTLHLPPTQEKKCRKQAIAAPEPRF